MLAILKNSENVVHLFDIENDTLGIINHIYINFEKKTKRADQIRSIMSFDKSFQCQAMSFKYPLYIFLVN